MPMIKVETSAKCDKARQEALALSLSSILSKCTGKPESYVQSVVEDGATIAFAGKIVPSALVLVKGIGGLTPQVNKALSKEICACLEKELGVSPSCTYINFADVPASDWGWKGSTFG